MTTPLEKYGDLFLKQLDLEDFYAEVAKEHLERSINKSVVEGIAGSTKTGRQLISLGFQDASIAVSEWLNYTMTPRAGSKPAFLSILKDMEEIYKVEATEGEEEESAETARDSMINLLTLIPMTILVNHLGSGADTLILNNLASQIGLEIQEEVKVEAFSKSLTPHVRKNLWEGVRTRGERRFKVYYCKQAMVTQKFVWSKWEASHLEHLCHQLLDLVIKGSGFFEIVSTVGHNGDEQLRAVPTEWLIETWKQNNDKLLMNAHQNCPMVIPPLPWNNLYDGGYYGFLHGRHTLIRSESLRIDKDKNIYRSKLLERLEEADISRVREAVNIMQATPWRINKRVYETLKRITELGGNIGGVPSLSPKEQLPPLTGKFTPEQLKKHKKDKWEIYREETRRQSIALRAVKHMMIADRYKDFERIYFPYNMDFRGRVYPISTFSPQSDDVNKGLLEFADAPACTSDNQIEWLMIHGANVAGVDKVSFEDRKQWVLDNEQQILKCAEDPIKYRWWESQDDTSFQLLAFCFEWARWKEYYKTYKTAKGFISSIPIAFDGTCSGLQHYSAILRDTKGGEAVNLIPGDSPKDVYRMVADKVNEELEKDLRTGTNDETVTYDNGGQGKNTMLKLGTRTLAQQWLTYGVTRKVTKRSVMTLPYGSKEFGFKKQILTDIVQKAKKEGRGGIFTNDNQASAYMAKKIWQSVQKVVVKAVEGMKYLQNLSRLVCKEGQVITWVTPMGLPVQQAYMQSTDQVVNLRLAGGIRRRLYRHSSTGMIDRIGQVNGVAPNFIHSMDASHLQLTVLNSYAEGITHFALIHDSFGCPLAQAGSLFTIIRQSFYDLYTQNDVFVNFFNDLIVFIDEDEEIPVVPKKGKLDLSVILESKYMFA